MSTLRALKAKFLVEGEDMRIDDADWAAIREHLPAAGLPTSDDLKVLVEMRTEARVVCPAFDRYFFPIFKASLLADGAISLSEQFALLRMLYGGGGIDTTERKFLQELRREVPQATPEFEALYQQALSDA